MNPLLRQFYENTPLREAVREFLAASLKDIAVEKALSGESTSGIKEANDVVEKSFDLLQQMYTKVKDTIIPNSR